MSGAGVTISFSPLTRSDIETLAAWMREPHWREWWGEPDAELGYIIDMIEGHDSTRPFFFHVDGKPLGYIQLWYIADQRDDEEVLAEHPWLALLPEDTIGVDLSIGDPARLSQGIGSAALSQFTLQLWDQGHRTIIIDPDPENHRAVRAYEKAGYRPIPSLLGRSGDSLIMQFDRLTSPSATGVIRTSSATGQGTA